VGGNHVICIEVLDHDTEQVLFDAVENAGGEVDVATVHRPGSRAAVNRAAASDWVDASTFERL
jgi:hypothetical protein